MSNDLDPVLMMQAAHGIAKAVSGPSGSNKTTVRYGVDEPPSPTFYNEELAPGVELNNFLKRTPSEDGTYVLVTEHLEHVEKVRQPPTPEELELKKEAESRRLKVLAGVGTFVFGVFGMLIWADSKKPRVTYVSSEPAAIE